jgi:Fructose-1-phosphate kinase and related fructose-6-phosphate kinase (PfkB)
MSSMNVCTLTMNPSHDRTVMINGEFKPGGLYRIDRAHENFSGKGINVSKALENLGVNVTTIIPKMAVPYRTNIKIIDSYGSCTELNENGGPITPSELDELMVVLEKSTENAQYIVIAGSIPQGVDKAVYNSMIISLKTRGIMTILDCDGEALHRGVEAKPYLIKPNLTELSGLLGTEISTTDEAVEKSSELHVNTGVNILCTLGGNGAVYAGNEGLYTVNSPQVKIRGFSGAGDTFLAAFLYERHMSDSVESALKFASSAAAAKVEMTGTDIPDKDLMRKYIDSVEVRRY